MPKIPHPSISSDCSYYILVTFYNNILQHSLTVLITEIAIHTIYPLLMKIFTLLIIPMKAVCQLYVYVYRI